jgi:hypothetical protein
MRFCNSFNIYSLLRMFRDRYLGIARALGVCLPMLLLCVAPLSAASTALISALEPAEGKGPEVLVISLSRQPATLNAFTLKGPDRLVLDMVGARLAEGNRSLPANHPLLRAIRAAQFNPQTVRVVLDLKGDVRHRIASRPAAGAKGTHEIVVSLFPATDDQPAATAGQSGQTPDSPAAIPAATAAQPSGESPATAAATPKNPAEGQTTKKIHLFGGNRNSTEPGKEAAPWGTVDLSGSLMIKGAQELHESGYPEQARSVRNTVRAEGKWTPPPSLLPQARQSGAPDTFVLASVQSDYLGFGPDPSADDYDLDLYEGYLHYATSGWDLRLGRQIVRWGKTDQISPVDNLNPQDMREFVLPDLEERKTPDWMARLRLFPGEATLEGVVIPFATENEFDFTGTTWALLGPEPTGLRIRESEPGNGLDEAGWGLRAGTTVGGWDIAASFLQATEKNPHLRLDPFNSAGPTLHAEYRRQNIFGLEFETTLDKFGFRGEAAYFDGQTLPTESLNSERPPVLHYVLGLDYIGEADWYANIQFSHLHIFDFEPDILFLREDNFFLNGEVNREFWRGHAMLKLRYAVDLRDGGSFFTPEAILTYFKNTELSLGMNLFFGPDDSYFGRYRDNDQIFLRATWHF